MEEKTFSLEGLPSEMRPSLEKFDGKPLNDVMRSYLEMEKLSSTRIPVPGDDASDETWEEFFGKLRPEKPDDYSLEVDDLQSLSKDELKALLPEFHKNGLTKRQADGVIKALHSLISGKEESIKTDSEKQLELLMGEIDETFGEKKDAQLKEINLFLERELGADFTEQFKAAGLDTNPKALKSLANFINKNKPDPGIDPNKTGNPTDLTKENLEKQRMQMLTGVHSKWGKALLDFNDPAHSQAVEENARIGALLEKFY